MNKRPQVPFPLSITLLYLILGGLWVFASHQIIHTLIPDPGIMILIQNAAGGVFVVTTALVLFLVVKREYDVREKAENKYRTIFENSPQGFFQSTPQGRFVNVNPSMARIFGYASPEEMIAQVTDINTQNHLSLYPKNS